MIMSLTAVHFIDQTANSTDSPPGVGKTLTAESVAENMRVPLYMMSAG